MENDRHAAEVLYSGKLLRELLLMPENARIHGVTWDSLHDMAAFVVEHPRLPRTPEGARPVRGSMDDMLELGRPREELTDGC